MLKINKIIVKHGAQKLNRLRFQNNQKQISDQNVAIESMMSLNGNKNYTFGVAPTFDICALATFVTAFVTTLACGLCASGNAAVITAELFFTLNKIEHLNELLSELKIKLINFPSDDEHAK